jgi:phosphoserine aminotransferase
VSSPHSGVFEFSAGPGVLPACVKAEIAANLVDFEGHGRSIVEMSHRGDTVVRVADEAEASLRALLNVPATHSILFMQGGGTAQFAAVPLNLAHDASVRADYAVTGTWTVAAAKEASKFVAVREVLNVQQSAGRFVAVPPQSAWRGADDADAAAAAPAYLYYTDNETVNGVEFSWVPTPASPRTELVCDMSSNFLSRPVDVARFGVIYAGAQKNCGIAGLTIVIVKKSLLDRRRADTPVVLDYKATDEKKSMLNTPPVFAIYVAGLVFKWILREGGVSAMEQRAKQRSEALYAAIDASGGFYVAPVEVSARSRMNVVFRIKGGDEALERKFVSEAQAAGLHTLEGHRSVGGLRASLYNAMPMEGVEALLAFMAAFRARNT